MSYFNFSVDDVITSYSVTKDLVTKQKSMASKGEQTRGLAFSTDKSSTIPIEDQFIVFQFNPNSDEGATILESSEIEPKISGSIESPDVLVALEMLSFNLGENESIDSDTRATMRINFGKDASSTDKKFDTVFWSIAAGLNLYDQTQGKPSESKDLNSDFQRAFANRPIEIPGGLGKLSFEVVKHNEPPWWKRIFNFGQSNTGQSLVSALGFPAITTQAIGLLDELFDKFDGAEPEVLFKSLPMRLALSKFAIDEFTGGNSRVRIGTLSRGFCVMARGRDYQAIAKSNSIYYPTYGKLVPANVSVPDFLGGKYEDPLKDITYAVFRLGMRETKLDPTFNYSS